MEANGDESYKINKTTKVPKMIETIFVHWWKEALFTFPDLNNVTWRGMEKIQINKKKWNNQNNTNLDKCVYIFILGGYSGFYKYVI